MIDRIPDNFLMESELTPEQEKIFINQINRFNKINSTYINKDAPLIDDMGELYFSEGTLIHGTSRFDEEMLSSISQTGVLTGQAVGISEDGETYYCADFHRVDKDITISQYNNEFSYNDGRCPFGRRCDNSWAVAFVVVPNDINRELLSYDCYREGTLESDITKSFVNNMPLADRKKASSILYGVPSNCIDGIVVGGKVSSDKEKINYLISLFPNSYIVSSFGELIYNPSMGERLGDTIIDTRIEKVSLEYQKRQSKKMISSRNASIIDLINKNVLLMDLISKNCDVNLFDNLDILSLLKMIIEELFIDQINYNNLDTSVLFGVIKSYLSTKIDNSPSLVYGNDRLLLENKIVSLKNEIMEDMDEIKNRDSLIEALNQNYNNLWNQMFIDCKNEQIINVLASLGWQGSLDDNYIMSMRDTIVKGYGK